MTKALSNINETILWFRYGSNEVLESLSTDLESGITVEEVEQRRAIYGRNELIETGGKSAWVILWEQFTSVMVLILVGAAVISALVGDWKDAGVISAIVILFGVLGFIQEYRAEKAMAALKRLAEPVVRVRRGGRVLEISALELVPGDVVLLEAGNKIPADCRLLEVANLRVEEAALTGESEPVEKETGPIHGENDIPLGDRKNMAYMGTLVTYGRGVAVVVETGMSTELGRIAGMIQNVQKETTPLQKKLDQLGKVLGVLAVAVGCLIFILGILRNQELALMIMTTVSVAVAAVPEGLPAVVTITLALGAQRMLRRHALIRKLPAVETLGSVTVICSDKTGTLTENKMAVTILDVAGHKLDLTERAAKGHLAIGAMASNDRAAPDPAIRFLLISGALCNDAVLRHDEDQREFSTIGDPTEGALVLAAAKFGLMKKDLERCLPRVAELPFDSDRKRMTTIHRLNGTSMPGCEDIFRNLTNDRRDNAATDYLAIVKGSVDGIIDNATMIWEDGRPLPMTEAIRSRVIEANDTLAANGMRVLGVGVRPLDSLDKANNALETETEIVFVGLVGMIDPPRAEVKEAVKTCKTAGIRTIMITGDHPLTAAYIARDLGISNGEARTVTGLELERMTDDELKEVVEKAAVFARVSPEHKFRIVEALQSQGHIVAMTGDGVNDAPALKKANIGVAMGITGTDASKEAAEMVLRDDNFATIVAAVEEGRTIYDNLKKFIKFSIAGNIGKILVVMVGLIIGMPLTLLPLQLLWLNLLTDGFLGLGLGLEKSERNVMKRPPYLPGESIFARGMGWHIGWLGLFIGVAAFGIGFGYWRAGSESWQTMIFTSLAFMQIAQALAIRSSSDSLFSIGLMSNRALVGMIAVVFVLQLAVIYIPLMQRTFGTYPLSAFDFAVTVAMGVALFAAVEFEKWRTRVSESEKA